jgi:hypothetical protein
MGNGLETWAIKVVRQIHNSKLTKGPASHCKIETAFFYVLMEVIDIILTTFKEHKVQAGEILEKSIIMSKLKELPPEKKAEIRDTWHYLIGNGILREVMGAKGPMLTELGYAMVYQD